MRIHMYMNAFEVGQYRAGKIAWGVSKEGRRDYSYMKVHVDVDEREVICMEKKTIPIRNSEDRITGETYEFISYDVQKGDDPNA